MTELNRIQVTAFVVLACVMGVVFFAYQLGVDGPFLLDDFNNLSPIAIGGGVDSLADMLRYTFGWDGMDFSRPVSRLSFLLDDQYWPSSPEQFKGTNISLHLVNGLLVALLIYKLLSQRYHPKEATWIAVICCGLWLVNPLSVSTTLYVVQRMTQLMLFFMLVSLLCYIHFLLSKKLLSQLIWLICAGLSSVLCVLSKENGATVLVFYFLINFFFFYPHAERKTKLIFSAALASVFIFACMWMFYLNVTGDTYSGREFTLTQRLLIQGEVLARYTQFWLGLSGDELTIFHDDVEWKIKNVGVGLSWTFWMVHAAVLAIAIKLVKSKPLISFGIFWFYVGHLVESSFIPLELMYEHRNYMPSIGLALIGSHLFYSFFGYVKSRGLTVLGVGVPLLYIAFLCIGLIHRCALWSDYRILASKWAAEHPNSLRAQDSFIAMLEISGMELMAYEKANEVYPRFNDPALLLHRLKLECLLISEDQRSLVIDLDEIESMAFSSGVNFYLNELMSMDQRGCLDKSILHGEFNDLIEAIGNMRHLKSKPGYYAVYLDAVANYYVTEKRYMEAVVAREKLWQVQPTIDTALKLSELFILGGNPLQAEKYLLWARQQNSARWYSNPNVDLAIANLERALGK
ncbi:hypothetical protein ACSV5M_19370 [Cellvibrio sp. ARAG 10.3]|uniref:hypothetical protein n=1 Tax=Cellvibrio sp. ARAG 10.3 TaxID=3451358 RepID=UPI003F45B161